MFASWKGRFGFATAGFVLTFAANAAKSAEITGAAGPTRLVLGALEKSAYEAWKSKDVKFWDGFLSDRFVGWGALGRLDKASAVKEYTAADCEVKSYALSDVQTTPLGHDAALITHQITAEVTCSRQTSPRSHWAASVYVREGNQWKAAFHAEAAVVNPATPMKPAGKKAVSQESTPAPITRDAHTDALLAREKTVWDAWKNHDANKLDGLTAENMQFINIFGIHLATKTEALKNWSGEGCDVKSVGLTDAVATMLSPAVGILTFHASADGTCFDQKVGPIWGSSIYVKNGETWQWNFGINLPAGVDE